MLPKRFTFPSPGFSHYWHYGFGKKMLQTLDQIPDKKEVEENGKLLGEHDALADKVITDVYEKFGFHMTNEILNKILKNGIDAVQDVPESLRQLFLELDKVPEWLNIDLLNAGSAFCRRTDVYALIVLRNYCLMGGYESSAINKPLIFTEALKRGAAKRMAETIEFWVNVTGESAMHRFERGFSSVVKVRIVHAFARVSIKKMDTWKDELWGIPINQGDMVATNLGFSLVFLEGLKRLGFRPTEKEIKGLFHFWKYIGYLLGIPASYLADTEKQAIASLYKWTISQSPADNDTIALASALMNEPLHASFPKYNWQKRLLIKIHLGYNYFFLGNRACETMKLPKTFLRCVPYLAVFFNRIYEFLTLSSTIAYKRAVKSGRESQEKIKINFLKGHSHHMQNQKL